MPKHFCRFIPAFTFFFCTSAFAQLDTTKIGVLEEAVIYSNKFPEKAKHTAQQVLVINKKSISSTNAANTADLLQDGGKIFVQKSQQGGGSPVLRGFEASRVLLLVDGIRMNHAIYRAGHLHNAITVDQNILESVEVLMGPASTLHGSDALGGAIHFRTEPVKLSEHNKTTASGNQFLRYRTVNREVSGHLDVNIGTQKFGWLQSYTFSKFGELKMGSRFPSRYPNFGRRSKYIETVEGNDRIVNNPDERMQKFSGYQQWDVLQKMLFKPSEKISHSLNLQLSNSSDVPRYDRLQDTKDFGGTIGRTLRFAEWYYGPQLRSLAAYQAQWTPNTGNEFKFQIHHQLVRESRQTREYLQYERFDSRREQIQVWGVNLDARMKKSEDEFTYGIDGQWNDLHSEADRTNLRTGVKTPIDTRYPDGRNRMLFLGLYGQHLRKIKKSRWVLNDGIRIQHVSIRSSLLNNSFFNFPFSQIQQDNIALTGNIGLVYNPDAALRVALNLSNGFRTPNIDDAARVFESSTSQRRLILPNPDIRPERTYNVDLNWIYRMADRIRFEGAFFYTLYRNAIALAPYRLNGADSVDYNGVRSAIYANQNARKGYLMGIQARLYCELGGGWSLDNTVSQTQGRYQTAGGEIPLDHIPPVFGRSGLQYRQKKIQSEIFIQFNGWKRLMDYNLEGEDNLQYATPDGMPGWMTLNWRFQVDVSKTIQIQGGVENLLDRNYRVFASGLSAPGRSWMIGVRSNF